MESAHNGGSEHPKTSPIMDEGDAGSRGFTGVIWSPKWGRGQQLFRVFLYLLVLAGVSGASIFGYVYQRYAHTLPDFHVIQDYQPKIGTRIYSADDQLVGEFSAERRVVAPIDKIPKLLFYAFVSAEDKRFFSHMGIDPIGISLAIFDKIRKPNSKLRGASTITQQVAKSLLAYYESFAAASARSLERKIREALLALRLEAALSKEEILFIYVNQIFLGHKAYGVQAASEHYFRKNVWELSLAEMATLAGLPQRPSDYSPYSRPEAARARRKYVLGRMKINGYIDDSQYQEALIERLTVYPRRELYLQIAPYYTEQVRRQLVDMFGERSVLEDGLKVYTALNLERQYFAQTALSAGLTALDYRQGYRGALATLNESQWPLFKQVYREKLGLQIGEALRFESSHLYLALVTQVEEEMLTLDIGGEEGLLPLAAMRWARLPDPTVRVDKAYVTDLHDVIQVGDILSVRRTSRAQIARSLYGWEVIKSVPRKIDKQLFRLVQEPVAQSGMLSVDARTGYVVAEVGGYNFEQSSFNRVAQACREPGSAFKPIVYSAAIDKYDYTASTLVDDKPLIYDDPDNAMRWKPNNAGMKFRGALPLRQCLMDSINTPAIRIAEAVGIDDIIANARHFGITTDLKRELGTALGSSCTTLEELIGVYVALNRYGVRKSLKMIRRVVDRFGQVIYDNGVATDPSVTLDTRLDRAYMLLVTPEQRVLDEQTAFLMVSLLQNVVRSGTAVGAKSMAIPIAGKTGTTNDSYDAWFMGFTKNTVTGVWVGHDTKDRPLGMSEYGGRTALPIWRDYMKQALTDFTDPKAPMTNPGEFIPPQGVVQAKIDPETGLLARPDMRFEREWYRAGQEPTELAPDLEVLNPDDDSMGMWGGDETPL